MLKLYIKAQDAINSFRRNQEGVVSFEYVIVAVCIVAMVGAAFSKTGALDTALTTGIAAITTTFNAAIGA